jgi:hypothetical protein
MWSDTTPSSELYLLSAVVSGAAFDFSVTVYRPNFPGSSGRGEIERMAHTWLRRYLLD